MSGFSKVKCQVPGHTGGMTDHVTLSHKEVDRLQILTRIADRRLSRMAYPRDRNRVGSALVQVRQCSGDVVRDMAPLFDRFGFKVTEDEIGGWGSVHRWVAVKHRRTP